MKAFQEKLSLPFHLFALLPFFLFLASALAQGEDQPHSDCSPFHYKCRGVELNISYPFRTKEYYPHLLHCSHPREEFEIVCNEIDATFEIEIHSRKYHVKMIDYENQTLTVVDKDFFGSNSCLLPSFETTTLDLEFFNYTEADLNLTFLYNCSHYSKHNPGFRLLECLSNSDDLHSYFTLQPKIPKEFEDCRVVKIPVLKEYGHRLETDPYPGAVWNDALLNGFKITWSPIDPHNQCGNCVRSKGHCGYNDSSPLQPICSCNGQPQTHTCPPQGLS